MTDFYNFASANPWLAFFLVWIVVALPLAFLFKFWNRWLRYKNIAAHGWPPGYCDADGNFRKTSEGRK